MQKESSIKKAIVIPDMQVPYHDRKVTELVEQYMKDNVFDYYINLGDFLDYFTISKFNLDKVGLVEGKTIIDELNQGAEVLDRHIKIIRDNNKNADIYYLEGNHEYRAVDFAHRNPTLKGIIEAPNFLKLKEKGVKYLRSWSRSEDLRIGKATFAHGRYTNQHHAKKMVDSYNTNIFYGHVHDTNCFNRTSIGNKHSHIGQSLGCLCSYPSNVDYTKGAPKNWQQAFAVFYFFPNGNFNYYTIRIYNNKFVAPDGKVYE